MSEVLNTDINNNIPVCQSVRDVFESLLLSIDR